jgi:hypothetical protein
MRTPVRDSEEEGAVQPGERFVPTYGAAGQSSLCDLSFRASVARCTWSIRAALR